MNRAGLRETLFPVIRCAMGLNVPGPMLSREDCQEIWEVGKKHSIQPVIWRGLNQMNVSADILKIFENEFLQCMARYVLRENALSSITGAFEEAKLSYIPLKGAVLQSLYPERWMRTSGDVDILIHEEDLAEAVKALEDKTDFRMDKRNYHDVSMESPKVLLELHFSLQEDRNSIDWLLADVWQYSHPTENGILYTMSAEYQIFYITAHMSYHMVHGGLGIRPLLDLWLLRNKTEYNEIEVRQMCEKCGILLFYKKCCSLTDAWMSGRSTGDNAPLEDFILHGGVFGSTKSVSAANQRVYKGPRYFLKRALADKEILQNEYPDLREKPYLLGWYRLKRLYRIFNKKKIASVRREIRGIRKATRQEIDSFDELLRSVGLTEE